MWRTTLLALCLSFCYLSGASAEESVPLKVSLLSEHETIAPGQEFQLILDVKLAPDWHAYWKNPGDTGMAPSVDWTLPPGVTFVDMAWPIPSRFEEGGMVTFGYREKAPLLVKMRADASLAQGNIEILAALQWVVCSSDTCLPGMSAVNAKLRVGSPPVVQATQQQRFETLRGSLPMKLAAHSIQKEADRVLISFAEDEIAMGNPPTFFPEVGSHSALTVTKQKGAHVVTISHPDALLNPLKGLLVIGEKAYEFNTEEVAQVIASESVSSLWMALFFAFLGGLILNLMPCVLPVVSLKVMNFVKMAGESRRQLMLHGALFSLGVLLSFWVLAIVLILLQRGGEAVGWGFQLQEPLFIAALALLFTLLGMSLFGVFEMGTQLASYAGEAAHKGHTGLMASFTSGVFATAVATPCTGPFMGSALGFALTQPAYVALAIFTALGLGMAAPYLLLGVFPALIRWLPKPGAWMETFKQLLGFVMLATVIWLLWVFSSQTGHSALFLMLFALLSVSLAAWVYGRFSSPIRKAHVQRLGKIGAVLCFSAALGLAYVASGQVETTTTHAQEIGWEPFSAKRLAELRANNTPVLIDFTAKWCLICQANHLALSQSAVEQKFQDLGVVRMKADWTKRDPEITQELRKHGRSGVPLYVLYGADSKPTPHILPQVLTPEIVMNTLDHHVR